jgi:hypothetical protein
VLYNNWFFGTKIAKLPLSISMTENWRFTMIEMRLSQQVKSCLPRMMTAQPTSYGRWEWRAHSFSFGDQECLVVMEAHSGYTMLFVDLAEQDYQHFDQVWQLRLLAEGLSLAELDELRSAELQIQLLQRSRDMLMTDDAASGQGQAFAEVRYCLNSMYQRYGRLPKGDDEEFRWGLVINRSRHHQGQLPFDRMRAQCLELTESAWQPSPTIKPVFH